LPPSSGIKNKPSKKSAQILVCSSTLKIERTSVPKSRLPFNRLHGVPEDRIVHVSIRKAGVRGSVVVEALCYKPEGRGIASRSGRTMALGSTQPLTEMSTRNLKKETWG
jgi:hypothetical protein